MNASARILLTWHAFARCLGVLVLGVFVQGAEINPGISAEIDAIELQARSNTTKSLELIDLLLQQTPPNAPQRLRLLGIRGIYLGNLGKHAEAKSLAAELEKLSDAYSRACAEMILGNDLRNSGNTQRAKSYLERAYKDLPADGDEVLRYHLYMERASIENQLGNLKESLQLYQDAAALLEKSKSAFRQISVFDSMASVLSSIGEQEKALQYNDRAMELAKYLGDAATLSSTWATRSSILDQQGQVDAAWRANQHANDYAYASGSAELIANSLTNLSDAELKAHRYTDALATALKAIDACKAIADVTCATAAQVNAGEAELGLGELAKGKVLIEGAISVSEKAGDRSTLVDLLKEYGEVLERAGDYKGAVAAFHRERKLEQEIYEGDRKKALLELDARYQSERKEKQIALLNRENQLKAAELTNRKLEQWIGLLGAGLLSMGLAVIAILYRRAREANLKLLASNEQLKVTSERDPLSGLFNRRYFHKAIQERIDHGVLRCGLLLFDIDHFKRINDTAGHVAGDAVIVEVARRIQAATRGSDFVARWGGEEFLAALAPMPLEQLDRLALRLLHAIADEPVPYGSTSIPVTVSIGYANFPLSLEHVWIDWERAINLIDMALYMAKAEGRNRACGIVTVASGGPDALDEIEADFQHACNDGRVVLKVQEGPAGSHHVALTHKMHS